MASLEEAYRARNLPEYQIIKVGCGISLFILGFTLFNLINFDPSFFIQNLYFPALNKYLNSSTNSVIFFDLKLENNEGLKGVHYDAMNLTFYSGANKSMAIGTYIVPGFYQGLEGKAQRRDVIATGSVPWQEAAITALLSGAKAGFMVDLKTKVKYKTLFWYSSKKKIVVGGKVEVDDSGMKVGKKAVKLVKSGTPPLRARLLVVTCLLVSVYFS